MKPPRDRSVHLAMFLEELPHRLIKMFAFRGDMSLDPFMGSGTTSLAAKNLERNSVGYEINPEFIEIARQKLNTRQPDFMGTEDKKKIPENPPLAPELRRRARQHAKSSLRSRRSSAPKKWSYPTG
ncbi:MAG: site-specific DNA-methyltransferase [Pelodictyon phaeoclathratiforme]